MLVIDEYGTEQIKWYQKKTKGNLMTATLKAKLEEGEEGELTVYIRGSEKLTKLLKSPELNSLAMKERFMKTSGDEACLAAPSARCPPAYPDLRV